MFFIEAVIVSLSCQSFLSILSRSTILLVHFSQRYVVKSGAGRRGRPPMFLHAHAVIACLLHFYTVTVEYKNFANSLVFHPQRLAASCGTLRLRLTRVLMDCPRRQFGSRHLSNSFVGLGNPKLKSHL